MESYMDILTNLMQGLLSNPIAQGMLLKAVKDTLPILFKQIDNSGIEKTVEPSLSPTLVVLAALVTAANLFMQGNLHTIDANSLVTYIQTFIQTYVGAKATSTVISTKVTAKLMARIKGQ